MKKLYQIPEIELNVLGSYILSEISGDGEVKPTANEDKTFDEGELSTDMGISSTLWDD